VDSCGPRALRNNLCLDNFQGRKTRILSRGGEWPGSRSGPRGLRLPACTPEGASPNGTRTCPKHTHTHMNNAFSEFSWRGTTREEDTQGTPAHSHISPSILVYEDNFIVPNRIVFAVQGFSLALCRGGEAGREGGRQGDREGGRERERERDPSV